MKKIIKITNFKKLKNTTDIKNPEHNSIRYLTYPMILFFLPLSTLYSLITSSYDNGFAIYSIERIEREFSFFL